MEAFVEQCVLRIKEREAKEAQERVRVAAARRRAGHESQTQRPLREQLQSWLKQKKS